MRHPSLLTAIVLALAPLALLANPASARNPAEIIRLTNLERQRYGLRPLKPHKALDTAASTYASTMARSGTLSHSLGSSLPSRISQAGYRGMGAGENIACGQGSSREVVADWMSSPGHRGNILSREYTHIGVGVRKSGNGQLYYCQVFGASR